MSTHHAVWNRLLTELRRAHPDIVRAWFTGLELAALDRGVALIRAAESLEKLKLSTEEQVGVEIVKKALESPLRQIAENAGERADVIIAEIKKNKDVNFGFDFSTGDYKDLVKAGIIDPAKVTRSALQNAASAAAMLLTTEAVVADIPEPEAPAGGGMPGGGMY